MLDRVARQLGWPLPERSFISDLLAVDADSILPGQVSAACGRAAYQYVTAAIDAALANEVNAIATGPIHKEALHAAGIPFPGHTEILADMTKSPRTCMMLTSDAITCSLVTVHVGYREVPALLTARTHPRYHRTDRRGDGTASRPQTATDSCAASIPHAGEHGLFGDREEEAHHRARDRRRPRAGIDATGPLPPDTAFLPKYRQQTDAYVCMYHDQGLIPLKALAFEDAVNVTLGLPIVRTSVDHGTAFDIAWKGVADVSSFVRAVQLAARLAR